MLCVCVSLSVFWERENERKKKTNANKTALFFILFFFFFFFLRCIAIPSLFLRNTTCILGVGGYSCRCCIFFFPLPKSQYWGFFFTIRLDCKFSLGSTCGGLHLVSNIGRWWKKNFWWRATKDELTLLLRPPLLSLFSIWTQF